MQISMGEELFDEKAKEEALAPTGDYLRAVDFEGEGLAVKMAEKAKREAVPNLGEGLFNIYTMEQKDGSIKTLTSKSQQLAKKLIDTHIQVGDWCRIKSEKIVKDNKEWTEFSVTKIELENPDVDTAKEFKAEPPVDKIPF